MLPATAVIQTAVSPRGGKSTFLTAKVGVVAPWVGTLAPMTGKQPYALELVIKGQSE